MENATIFDYERMCRTNDCESCPFKLSGKGEDVGCADFIIANTNKANEIILKWCKEHQIKTRQSEFLKIIPNLVLNVSEGYVDICPNDIDEDFNCKQLCDNYTICRDCKKDYWFAEVDKNE